MRQLDEMKSFCTEPPSGANLSRISFFLQVMVETSESLFDDLWSVFTSIEAHSEAHVENSSETTPHKMYVESVERLQISSEQLEKILDTRWSKVKVAQSGNNKKN